MPLRREAAAWLEEARADLAHAEASRELGHHNWACFAAHQAAEKALKAIALHALGEFPRGHDLVRLYRLVKDVVPGLSEPGLAKLSMYYTVARYPNAGIERPSEEIGGEQSAECIGVARTVLDAAARVLQDP